MQKNPHILETGNDKSVESGEESGKSRKER